MTRFIASTRPLTGERWTRERLEELREASYSPRAVAAFLAAARRRSADQRRARPRLARQARSWATAGALAWLGLAALGRQPFRARLRSGLASWGATSLMLGWHLGMVETEDGRARLLGAADACTLLRAWLIPVVADAPRPFVCVLALASDGLDGALARASAPTRLGRDLEGVVDAAFAGAALRGAARQRSIGRLILTVEAGRIAAGALYTLRSYLVTYGPPDRGLARAGRVSTPVRMAGIVAAQQGRRRIAAVLLSSAAAISALAASRVWIDRSRSRSRHASRATVESRRYRAPRSRREPARDVP